MPRSLTAWLSAGLITVVIALAATAVATVVTVRAQARIIATVARRDQPLAQANLRARADFAEAQAVLRAYVLSRHRPFLGLYNHDQSHLASAMRATLAANQTQLVRDVNAESRAVTSWIRQADAIRNLPPGDPRVARLTVAVQPSVNAFYAANDNLDALLRARLAQAVNTGGHDLTVAYAWTGALVGFAVLAGFGITARTIHRVSQPLAEVNRTVRRFASGDLRARAPVTGMPDICEVSRSLNALADESERLRQQQREANRMRDLAWMAGLRIRERLRVEEVVAEAQRVITEHFDADVAAVHLLSQTGLGAAVGRIGSGHPPDDRSQDERSAGRGTDPLAAVPENDLAFATDLLRRGSSQVIQDLAGPEASVLPDRIRFALRRIGVVSHLLAPFGLGGDVYGVILMGRTRRGAPWSRPEAAAVESIAADLGRGLHHARLYEEESKVVGELTSLDRARSDFLATVSHELRTPLTSIAGYVELLHSGEAGSLNEAQIRMLEAIYRNTGQLRSLIEDVLTLSKIESGAFKTCPQPVDLAEIASSVAVALLPTAAGKGVSLTVEAPQGPLIVNGDPGQLDRALMNVVSNALKFTQEQGAVRVVARADNGWGVVSVRDNGMGIPQADQPALLTRFFRGANAIERSIPGTGLGLAIVRTIVDNHGGQVVVESAEGRGTTVTLRFPLVAAVGAWQHVR
jgi:two-component system phosphate regulon sensor histidine kinase PhoR